MRIVYSPKYDLPAHYLGRRVHPFDLRKYGRAYRQLGEWLGPRLAELTVAPPREIGREELLSVHTAEYLERLRTPSYFAAAVEVPLAAKLPAWVYDRMVLRPMRWGTMGTVVAAREALSAGVAVNLSGGYHHAKPDGAEGFCFYADIAIAVAALRRDGLLAENDRVAYVDLDAHQGNGVSYCFMDDSRALLFDAYNAGIYPCYDRPAIERIDCDVPLAGGCGDDEYLGKLRERLPGFLDSVTRSERVGLAIYNAGTDIYADDALGGLAVSAEGVLARDVYVIEQLRERGMATAMLPSGGYSDASYRLVANSVKRLVEMFA